MSVKSGIVISMNISMTHEINDSENTVIGIRTLSGICKNKDKKMINAVITKAAAKTARNTRKNLRISRKNFFLFFLIRLIELLPDFLSVIPSIRVPCKIKINNTPTKNKAAIRITAPIENSGFDQITELMNFGTYKPLVSEITNSNPIIGESSETYRTTSMPGGFKNRFRDKKPSLIQYNTDGFSPVKSLLHRITRAFKSTATNRNRLTIAKIISSIPCHVVNRNEKSPLVTATCPVLLINSLDMTEKHDIQICRAREEII